MCPEAYILAISGSPAIEHTRIDRTGFTCRGHSPASTLNRLDLPEPLGPMTMMLRPGGTSNVSSLTSLVPSGELRATLHRATASARLAVATHNGQQCCCISVVLPAFVLQMDQRNYLKYQCYRYSYVRQNACQHIAGCRKQDASSAVESEPVMDWPSRPLKTSSKQATKGRIMLVN